MTAYRVRIESDAFRDVATLPGHVRQSERRAITRLGSERQPAGSRPLRDHPGYFRLRIDNWRIIYLVDDNDQTVTIIAVKRKTGPETYNELP